jgi:serine protease
VISFIHGQDNTVSFRISSDEEHFNLSNDNKSVMSARDTIISNLLNSKEGFSMRQSFPYSKYSELLKLYTVTCFIKDTFEVIDRLKRSGSVFKIMQVQKPISMYEPDDWYYAENKDECWHLDKLQCSYAWDISKGSNTATMAIIDTKFDYEHPDLNNKFILGYDPFTGINHIQIQTGTGSNDAHGTSVASTAIAETDGGGLLASVGFNTKFYGYTWENSIEKAHHASFALGVDVINCSFFYSCSYNSDEALAISEIIDNGTIIVSAAGNGVGQCYGGETCPFCSLNDDRVIVVSSTARNDQHTLTNANGDDETDSHYPGVDICAPGIDIPVATPSGGTTWPYFGFSGQTSISSPMVAATCVLMRDVNKCISPEAVENVLKETADPITDASLYPGQVGAGRLNVYQALLGAIEEGTIRLESITFQNPNTFNSLYFVLENTIVSSTANITINYEEDITLSEGFEVDLGGQVTFNQATYECP